MDEARLFLDAPIWADHYFYGQVEFLTRESYDSGINLGELYLDFEDVSKLWGKEPILTPEVLTPTYMRELIEKNVPKKEAEK